MWCKLQPVTITEEGIINYKNAICTKYRLNDKQKKWMIKLERQKNLEKKKQQAGKREKKDKNKRGGAETYKGINATDLQASSSEGTRLLAEGGATPNQKSSSWPCRTPTLSPRFATVF